MMRSPRFIRPHRILIRNKVGEKEGQADYQTTTVNHVCVDAAYGIEQSQKGIDPKGDLLVILDMNDIVAFEGIQKRPYIDPVKFEELTDTTGYFTLRPDVDIIVYKGHEYTVNGIGEVNPFKNEPAFLEITANE